MIKYLLHIHLELLLRAAGRGRWDNLWACLFSAVFGEIRITQGLESSSSRLQSEEVVYLTRENARFRLIPSRIRCQAGLAGCSNLIEMPDYSHDDWWLQMSRFHTLHDLRLFQSCLRLFTHLMQQLLLRQSHSLQSSPQYSSTLLLANHHFRLSLPSSPLPKLQ